jgi:LysM repeat protein
MEPEFDGNGLHIVHDGDTLMGIALKYNVNVNNLKRLNNLHSTVLSPGQVSKSSR